MPYELALELEQEQHEANKQAREDQRLNGQTDGAFGYKPQYADEAYLEGYCLGIKELPKHRNGLIDYRPQNVYADPGSYDKWVLMRDDEF